MIIRDLSHRDYRMVGIIILDYPNPTLVVFLFFIHIQHSKYFLNFLKDNYIGKRIILKRVLTSQPLPAAA